MNIHKSSTRSSTSPDPAQPRVPKAHCPYGLWAATLFAAISTLALATSGRGYKTRLLRHFRPHSSVSAATHARHAATIIKPVETGDRFEHIKLPNTFNISFTCVEVGPDRNLYAGADDGRIFRYPIQKDGRLGTAQVIKSLQIDNGGNRLLTGFCFDPASTADNVILWAAHGYYAFTRAPDWTGKITRLSGANLEIVQDAVIHLPRSIRDHLTNQPSFGPDGALYFPQGCNTAKGAPDKEWGDREEHLLSGTILRLDVTRITPGQPLDAQTIDADGCYDPAAPDAPLTVYATGVRNAFDLVWASNGRLYVPNNGSCMGGNTPAGPGVPALNGVMFDETDFLYRITPGKYYGHPNVSQGHYVLNGGHPAGETGPAIVQEYPTGTPPDSDWEPAAYDLGLHASANGIIEYTGPAFGGKLNHTLLVIRYNVGCDIVTLRIDPAGKVSALDAGIGGLGGFVNPLDLAEDRVTGNLYVAEYGGRHITLLRWVNNTQPKVSAGAIP